MRAFSTHRKHRLALAALTAASALGLAAGTSRAQAAPPRPGPPGAERGMMRGPGGPRDQKAESINGAVESYNFGPRGNIEGLMIKSGDRLAQVNLPPDMGAAVAQQATVGSQVQLSAVPEPGMHDHPVYRFISMKSGDHELKVPMPGDERFVHLDSTVKQLNYGRHGEVNGALLESGDLVHFGSEAASGLKLQPGTKLTVDGIAHPMLMSDHQSIDAVAINGQVVHHGPGPGPGGEPPRPRPHRDEDRGPGGPRHHGPPPGGPEGAPPPPPPPAPGPAQD